MPTFRDDPKLGCMVPMMKTDDINDQAITKDKIRDGNVTTEKLADGAVSTDKLPNGAIKASKIADENITTDKLAEGAVETSKIADRNVTSEKIADQSVDSSKLSPEAVTYDKVKDKAIITEKLNDRAVTTEKVEERAITNPKLGNQSVDGRVVREASLETKHFANGSVTTEKIKDGSVTNEKVADDTLGIEKFDPELRKTIQAATGLPEDLSQMIQDVDKSVKQLKEKDTDLQSQINDKQQQITANDGDISLLQTRSTQMEKAIKNISASGGASQATAVTYENTESGLDSVTAQGAIDELANKKFNKENIAQEFGDSEDKVVSQSALPFREIESPEFIKAIVDAEDHFLFGIQLDGSIEWGKGIPAPIRAKLQEIINQCQQDKTDVLEAINAAKEELSSSITALQEGKVDKEEGKSLIEDEVKECFKVIENEEFIHAVVDSEDRLLFGIYRDSGKPYFPLNEMYHVEQNEEFFAVWLDAANHVLFGIRRDGQIIGEIHAVNALKQVISQLQADVAALQEKVGTIDTNLKELLDVFSLQENSEYLAVEQDAEGKVLSATYNDGSHYIHNAKSETIPTEFNSLENKKYSYLILDKDDRILLSIDAQTGDILVNNISIQKLKQTIDNEKYRDISPRMLDLPKYGIINIDKEIYYTDASNRYYPSNDVKDVNGIYYVKSTLQDGIVTESSISVTEVIGSPQIDKWKVDKNVKHKCIVVIDFGSYLKGQFYIEVKFQGASTLYNPKHNFRLTFYKDESFSKKKKIKMGEMVEQSGYNVKAYYSDTLRIREPILNAFILNLMEQRDYENRYPWNSDTPIFTSAVGLIKQFPCRVEVSGEFYGLEYFGLKKDGGNFMISKDEDGMILCGTSNSADCWSVYKSGLWEDEFNDTLSISNEAAIKSFYDFINSSDFTRETSK